MAEPKPSLYFITTEVPWPATSGGRIKTFRFIQFLSEHYEVRLACAYGTTEKEDLTALREASGISSVQVFGKQQPRTAFNWFMAIMQFPTFNSFRVYSKKMESIIQWGIEKADVTIVDHLEMLEMIPARFVPEVIYHSHNAEFKLWGDYALLEKNPIKKWVLEWEADRVKVFEQWAIKKTKFTFAAPNDSARIIEKSSIDPKQFRLTYHLGDEALLEAPQIKLSANKPQVFFGGTLSWVPNSDGLNWFVSSIWPNVLSAIPEAKLIVCGSGANKKLQMLLKSTPGIDYKGFVDSIEMEMSQCRCAIVPLRFGSGMKIKTLDALYRGLPVVSTTIGIEGIDIEDGVHASVPTTDEEWCSTLTSILQNPELGEQRALAGRELVASKYTYPLIFPRMLEAIQQ